MAILAIDQSTQATKALVLDDALAVLGAASAAHRQYYPKPGWVEHDAQEILRHVQEAAKAALAACPAGTQICCVSLSNQRETLVLWDAQTGMPVCRALVWQDARAAQDCRALGDAAGLVFERSGMPLSPLFSAAKLRWCLKNDENAAALYAKGRLRAGTMDAFLADRLCGRYACDFTNASRTQLMNLEKMTWDARLCEVFGVNPAMLPEILPSDAVFGQTDLGGVLPKKVPLCGVSGDSQAAFFALGCHQTGRAKASYGTGSSVMVHVGDHIVTSGFLAATVGYRLAGQTGYALEGNISHSADIVSWLTRDMQLCPDPAQTEPMARALLDNGGVYLVPAFTGLGAPWFEPDARAMIWGMSRDTRPAHLVRAGLEAIAYQIGDVLGEMAGAAGVPVTRLDADGGACANAFLMQFQADLIRAPLQVARYDNLSALGAAMAGGIGMGLFENGAAAAALLDQRRTYLPGDNEAQMRAWQQGWVRARNIVLAQARI